MLKLIMIACIALAISYTSDRLSEPPASHTSQKYHEEYNSNSDRALSEQEFERLKQKEKKYFEEITSPDNLKSDLEHILKRKTIIIPISVMFWLLVGIFYGFKDIRYIVGGVVIITFVSLIYINVFEAALYAIMFLIGNIYYNRRIDKKLIEEIL